ncbi:MAG: winged helix-turn-helix domain-containing protein, partial [Clostridia bacterium]|nr:winged helix-turn-helix domain-containing protein [Clostridia bacterium]
VDGLSIDFTSRIVKVDGIEIKQTPKEYDILFYLIKNRGVVIRKRFLIERIWGNNYKGDDRTLDTHIKLLRKHLGVYGEKIKTLRGVGYRFDI